jgi:hypothetical protein
MPDGQAQVSCVDACFHANLPRTIQIRDVDDDVYSALARRAAEAGLTVPDLLRREAARLAARPTVEEWLARTRRRPSNISRAEVIEAVDELRGPWLDAGR